MLNMGKARQLMELYVGHDVSPELARELMNIKLREFCDRSRLLEAYAELSSVASTAEYELPLDCLHIKRVHYDDYKAGKITASDRDILEGID